MITIERICNRAGLKRFAEFPNELYKGNPYYVPTLVVKQMHALDKDVNASFEFCDADYFLALKDGKVVGRVAAIYNPRAIEAWQRNSVRFGWIDFIDDPEVSAALISAVADWGRERGCDFIEGPMGFTDFDPEGMLVEGFDQLGTAATIYNHPYYKEHLEALGFTKQSDWVEYKIELPDELPERYERMSKLLMEKHHLTSRHYTRREIKRFNVGHKLFNLINNTYSELYGFSRLSEGQIKQYVDNYVNNTNLDLASFIVDDVGEIAGFGLMIPSLSKALQQSKGYFLPRGWWHISRALKSKDVEVVDMLIIAVRKDLQKQGLPALIVSDLFPKLKKKGFKVAESNPEWEHNIDVQNLWTYFTHVQHKRRRVYGKSL
jgi:GNAT superfamily N-acetyltransferase